MKNISNYFKRLLIISSIIAFTSCSKDSPSEPEIDAVKLNDAFAQAGQIMGIKSLAVAKDGVIIKEQYFNTGGPDKTHDVRSVTKSVTGILIGIAIDKGYLKSPDQTIGEFISPLIPGMSSEKENIKIRDLLTMSSGFSGNELANVSEYNNWIISPNQVQTLVNRALVAQPGQIFNYNSAALHLLSVIITRATNMKTQDFAEQYLFDPLGITQYYWETDNQGYNNGAAGLNITPHDMIKIGQLILNRGEYNGQRIVSPGWVDQSTVTQISTNNAQKYGPGYGFCWWTGQNDKGNYAFANGWGGQFIFVIPSLKLVVSATNNWSGYSESNADNDWVNTIDLIMGSIIPSFH